MSERLLSPSKIAAWLECEHYLTLRREIDEGSRSEPSVGMGEFARLLLEKGLEHEDACRRAYESEGRGVFEVEGRRDGETFERWVKRVGSDLRMGHDVVFQMPFVHEGVRGIADFLERVDLDDGSFTYEPVDAKLARAEAKPGHVLQLCFYAEAIEDALGAGPESVHVWLGSGRRESIRLAEVAPYWRRLRASLLATMQEPSPDPTAPEPCSHCAFCEFAGECEREWREADALHFVSGIRREHKQALIDADVDTLETLSTRTATVQGLDDDRLERLRHQAILQVEARSTDWGVPPYRHIPPDDPADRWGRGHELLPAPDMGDVFLDFEGHPFWRADRGLFFLFGFVSRLETGEWVYTARWAHDEEQEAQATRWLVDELWNRREQYPGMHVYHYNHTERSSLQALHVQHDLDDARLAVMIREGAFVDLLEVVRNALQVGTESYGLKHLELLAGYERQHDIDAGAGAVVAYEQFTKDVSAADRGTMGHEDDPRLADIAAYNEDDVRATLALHRWLLGVRPMDVAWRAAVLHEEPEADEDVHEVVTALRDIGGDQELLLANLLGYWRREDRVHAAQLRALAESDPRDLLDEPAALAYLEDHRVVDVPTPTGRKAKRPSLVARFPEQEVESFEAAAWITPAGPPAYASATIDVATGEVVLKVSQESLDRGDRPMVVVANDWVGAGAKFDALLAWAGRVVQAGGVDEVDDAGAALLGRRPTRFRDGRAPTGVFPAELEDQAQLVTALDRSCLAMQGPPGTGKTYRAARMIRALLLQGRRVGVTALSHAAIHNLVGAVHDAMVESGDEESLAAIVKRSSTPTSPIAGVQYVDKNEPCGDLEYNLVAGTSWLFANRVMAAAPVDVLFVDEAGQLGLADVLAAATSAESLVLAGDPQQLPQVSQATHPAGAGASVLEHVLAGERTLPDDKGIFLAETWRLHPDICEFISDQFYDGRLTSHSSCGFQSTGLGTGLRWVEARHSGCSTRSDEEVDLVGEHVAAIIGRTWTDQDGARRELTAGDVMVVTPYNRQKDALRRHFNGVPELRDVRVGTVDKFQGQEAAVVLFSAAASSAEDAARGVGFVFDRHRFNVAISRARCLAILVCTRQLLEAYVTSIDAMRTVAAACDFVERATEMDAAVGGIIETDCMGDELLRDFLRGHDPMT